MSLLKQAMANLDSVSAEYVRDEACLDAFIGGILDQLQEKVASVEQTGSVLESLVFAADPSLDPEMVKQALSMPTMGTLGFGKGGLLLNNPMNQAPAPQAPASPAPPLRRPQPESLFTSPSPVEQVARASSTAAGPPGGPSPPPGSPGGQPNAMGPRVQQPPDMGALTSTDPNTILQTRMPIAAGRSSLADNGAVSSQGVPIIDRPENTEGLGSMVQDYMGRAKDYLGTGAGRRMLGGAGAGALGGLLLSALSSGGQNGRPWLRNILMGLLLGGGLTHLLGAFRGGAATPNPTGDSVPQSDPGGGPGMDQGTSPAGGAGTMDDIPA